MGWPHTAPALHVWDMPDQHGPGYGVINQTVNRLLTGARRKRLMQVLPGSVQRHGLGTESKLSSTFTTLVGTQWRPLASPKHKCAAPTSLLSSGPLYLLAHLDLWPLRTQTLGRWPGGSAPQQAHPLHHRPSTWTYQSSLCRPPLAQKSRPPPSHPACRTSCSGSGGPGMRHEGEFL